MLIHDSSFNTILRQATPNTITVLEKQWPSSSNFMVVLLIAVAVASIPSAHGARTLETVEQHVNLPVVVASSPTRATTEITFDVPEEAVEAEGPTAPGPDTVGNYDDKTPITGPL
jgi:hypothetical protein